MSNACCIVSQLISDGSTSILTQNGESAPWLWGSDYADPNIVQFATPAIADDVARRVGGNGADARRAFVVPVACLTAWSVSHGGS